MGNTVNEGEPTRSFAFVDLAGFTALTETHGDQEAVDLIDRFEAIGRQSLSPGDQLVKTIGDAVMLAFPEPLAALRGLERLFEACESEPKFPDIRAGAHHGAALARHGDWFGATINLAARVAAQARGGQLLVTAAIGAEARAFYDVTELGCFELRNIQQRVELFDIALTPHDCGSVVDPVCQMRIMSDSAVGQLRHHGTEFRFCSLECVQKFAADADRFSHASMSEHPK